ncbi:MAG: hypothetical protein JST94_02370 [Bacteroidetes bacterium]|nr:hypothetical protein [Bacteroidota bacterium]
MALYNKNRQAYIADTYGIKAESVTSNFKLNEIKKQVINNPIELPEKQ